MAEAVAAEKAIKAEKTVLKDKTAKARLDADPAYKQRLAAAARACKRLKDDLQPECQKRWRGPALRWLRAALVLGADGKATFPSLLGTGGNDGKLDFTNNALQRLGDLFDLASPGGDAKPDALPALRASLFGAPSRSFVGGGIGQYAPAAAGGPNATAGALGDSHVNPWDLPLLLEGALLFTASASRRLGGAGSERTLAPFSVRSFAAGYASAATADESSRGEQWLPLWSRPWTAAEVSSLLLEGRCQVGRRSSDDAVDLARAIARLGLARGVDAFERYAYMERNGKSNYAVPIGRWRVHPEPQARLLDDLMASDWWGRVRRAARDDHAPARLREVDHRLDEAVVGALAHAAEPGRWQQILVHLALLEQQLVDSGSVTVAKRLQPIPLLSPGWIKAADDGSVELRLALALASAGAPGDRSETVSDSVRAHWLPLDGHGRFAVKERGLWRDPRVVMSGQDAEGDLVRLVQRRLVEATSGASRRLPISGRTPLEARLDDLMALVSGLVDLRRTVLLARAFAALDFRALRPGRQVLARTGATRPVDPLWAAVRLSMLPWALDDARSIPADPAVARMLAAGEGTRAVPLVLQRLRAHGVHVGLSTGVLEGARARRFAASLAFPISRTTASALARALDPQGEKRPGA
jgi:CRISPR-associated protein Csx17